MTDKHKNIAEECEKWVQIEVNSRIDKLIIALSKRLSIDKQIIDDAIREFDTILEQNKQINLNIPIVINTEKCLGKTKYNTQCSRSKQKDSLFCGSHLNKLPYGRVDYIAYEKINGKKRGRPKKNSETGQ